MSQSKDKQMRKWLKQIFWANYEEFINLCYEQKKTDRIRMAWAILTKKDIQKLPWYQLFRNWWRSGYFKSLVARKKKVKK